jgi:tryptophan synthase alpha chain
MNRIQSIFKELAQRRRGALMPFLTAGYPSMELTAELLPRLGPAGASICELGFPFSDPIADGPVISASMTEALAGGFTPDRLLQTVRRVREQVELGLVAMVSYSLVYRRGVQVFVEQAQQAGFDGFIFPDLPLEEAEAVTGPVADAGMTMSLLIAPTTPMARAEQIARRSSGFVYIVAHTGITGQRDRLPDDLTERIGRLRHVTDLPLAVGFGISRPEHVRAVTEVADAAIVGSALVKRMGEHAGAPVDQQVGYATSFVRELADGLASR